MPNLHLSGFRLRLLDLVLPPLAGRAWCRSTLIPHHLPAGLPWPGLPWASFPCPEMLPGWKVRKNVSFDILDAKQPIQSCVLEVRELKHVFPRVRLTVHVLRMLCMCPDCSPNLRFLKRSEQSQGCPHCFSL